MHSAEVVIIGGGIVGSSIAWHLTEAGCRDVLVIEREPHLGSGSTGKSMGGVRAQFSTEANIRMSLYSIPYFAEFQEKTGHPSGYRAQGYLFVATSQPQLEHLRENCARQSALGLHGVCLLAPGEIMAMLPQLRSDDIAGGSFCPTDGFVDPYSVMTGFMERAVERGARLWRGAAVTGISVGACGVERVETFRDSISTRTVVNAAGPWAAQIAGMAGIDLPVVPLRRMLVPTEPFDRIPHNAPMVVDMKTGFHFRPEGRCLLLAWNDPDETPGYKAAVDTAFIEKILTRAVDRVPCLAEAAVNPRRAWAGLYEVTPDHHAILGPAPGVPGFYLANGFSGHGVMHSPATGRILADLILEGRTAVADIAALGVERFAAGRLLAESQVL